MGPIDWLEGSVYMGLLFVAGFVCVLRLLGASLLMAPEGSQWSRRQSRSGNEVGEARA